MAEPLAEDERNQRCTVTSGVVQNPRSEVQLGHQGPIEGPEGEITLPGVSMVYLKGCIAK